MLRTCGGGKESWCALAGEYITFYITFLCIGISPSVSVYPLW